ncbi:helicase [Legionella wadsworthii]|uniref:Helicase n=1 Tax=Legionella wadsworthii TaxID=28088 RepID=A0A378LZF4_9GAMM|nr:LirA/MavJ family T4SS effector [Legionella wadsworthii]STY29441.1 helicase [Legionella wadsworthii]
MTIELIRTGEKDINNYEQTLSDFGYTDLRKEVKEDAIAVWKYFCSEGLVKNGLKKFVSEYFKFYQKENKSLRQFFNEWGKNNHFNKPRAINYSSEYTMSDNFQFPETTPILYGELTADFFYDILLQNGYLSADLGAGPEHGKWAHSIQMYLLEEARKEGTLQLHSASVCHFLQTISQVKGPYESLSLWNILFDSFEEHLYTFPNNITKILSSDWDASEAAKFFSTKLNAYADKFKRIAKEEASYEGYAKKKYLSRLNEASYIFYKEKCALLWFASKEKNDKSDSVLINSLNSCSLGS